MDFSTTINGFNTEYNLNAVSEYNKLLQGQASFEFNTEKSTFENALDTASKSIPLRDKNDFIGLGNFMDKMGNGIGSALNAVNMQKIEADRMQEDIAMGGPTSIHDAMIAAEKAELSMRMAVQVRNRILDAYTQITTMGL